MFLPEFEHKPEALIGTSCHEVIKLVLRLHPEIARIGFAKFIYTPQVIGKEKGDVFVELTREEIFRGRLNEEIAKLESSWDMGIYSRVILTDSTLSHIPMMDFILPKTAGSVDLIRERLRGVVKEQSGFILESGQSYHYYGTDLLPNRETWINFMARCLLTSVYQGREQPFLQVADPRYIGHSLLGGGCVLRISTNAERKFMPVVVDIL